VPVVTPDGLAAADECPRGDTSLDALARLRPAFEPGETVTAGNACPLNDGTAMVLVTSLARVRGLGARSALAFRDGAAAGVDPNLLGIGPVASTRKLLGRAPWLDLEAVHAVEFNEAFAARVLASLDQLGIDPARINRDGGALALGHPFGASGAVLVTRLYAPLVREPRPGTPGGGLGLTALFERIDFQADPRPPLPYPTRSRSFFAIACGTSSSAACYAPEQG
jgi:acetyl-CoA C-acetyltransferase